MIEVLVIVGIFSMFKEYIMTHRVLACTTCSNEVSTKMAYHYENQSII